MNCGKRWHSWEEKPDHEGQFLVWGLTLFGRKPIMWVNSYSRNNVDNELRWARVNRSTPLYWRELPEPPEEDNNATDGR